MDFFYTKKRGRVQTKRVLDNRRIQQRPLEVSILCLLLVRPPYITHFVFFFFFSPVYYGI
jgi:hypothetical protein